MTQIMTNLQKEGATANFYTFNFEDNKNKFKDESVFNFSDYETVSFDRASSMKQICELYKDDFEFENKNSDDINSKWQNLYTNGNDVKEELKNANKAAQDIKNTVSGVQKSAFQKFEGFKNSIFKQ